MLDYGKVSKIVIRDQYLNGNQSFMVVQSQWQKAQRVETNWNMKEGLGSKINNIGYVLIVEKYDCTFKRNRNLIWKSI